MTSDNQSLSQNLYKTQYKSKFWNFLFKVRENYFITACSEGNFAKMEYYLKNGVDVDTTAGYGYSALSISTRNTEVCEFLLKWGASIPDKIFLDACMHCTIEVSKSFLGPIAQQEDLKHRQKSEEIIALLLQYGANPDAVSTHRSISALSILASKRSPRAVETLLKHHPQNIGEALFHANDENRAIIASYCTKEELKIYLDDIKVISEKNERIREYFHFINTIYLAKTLDEEMPVSEKKKMHKI